MIIVLKQEAKNEDVTRIEQGVKEKGLEAHICRKSHACFRTIQTCK